MSMHDAPSLTCEWLDEVDFMRKIFSLFKSLFNAGQPIVTISVENKPSRASEAGPRAQPPCGHVCVTVHAALRVLTDG